MADFWLWTGALAVTLLGLTLGWLAFRPRILARSCVEVATLIGVWAILSGGARFLATVDVLSPTTALIFSGSVGLGIIPALWLSIGRRRA